MQLRKVITVTAVALVAHQPAFGSPNPSPSASASLTGSVSASAPFQNNEPHPQQQQQPQQPQQQQPQWPQHPSAAPTLEALARAEPLASSIVSVIPAANRDSIAEFLASTFPEGRAGNLEFSSISRAIDSISHSGLGEFFHEISDFYSGASPGSSAAGFGFGPAAAGPAPGSGSQQHPGPSSTNSHTLGRRDDTSTSLVNTIADFLSRLLPGLGSVISSGLSILGSIDFGALVNLLTSIDYRAIASIVTHINFTAIGDFLRYLLSLFGYAPGPSPGLVPAQPAVPPSAMPPPPPPPPPPAAPSIPFPGPTRPPNVSVVFA